MIVRKRVVLSEENAPANGGEEHRLDDNNGTAEAEEEYRPPSGFEPEATTEEEGQRGSDANDSDYVEGRAKRKVCLGKC